MSAFSTASFLCIGIGEGVSFGDIFPFPLRLADLLVVSHPSRESLAFPLGLALVKVLVPSICHFIGFEHNWAAIACLLSAFCSIPIFPLSQPMNSINVCILLSNHKYNSFSSLLQEHPRPCSWSYLEKNADGTLK